MVSSFKKKQKAKILWLSDIHYRCLSSINKQIRSKNEFEGYFSFLKKEISKIENYTHLVITGDLAFSGTEEEYNELFKCLIKPLLKKNIRFIIIAGNHDICQDLLKIDPSAKNKYQNILKRNERNKAIAQCFSDGNYKIKPNNDLINLTKNYRKFFLDKVVSFLPKSKIEFFGYKESEGLTGIIYDKEFDLIFICLNSSWYSFGQGNIIDLINHTDNQSITKLHQIDKNLLNEIINKNEFGHLELGPLKNIRDKIDELKRKKILEECTVITLVHHPLSWLSYETQYSINDNELALIFKNTDICLSGHQHVPYNKPNIYRDQLYIFEAPQLNDIRFFYEFNCNDNNNIGFYTIDLDQEKSRFNINKIQVKIVKEDLGFGDILNYRSINSNGIATYKYLNKGGKTRFVSRKSVFNGFTNEISILKYFKERLRLKHNLFPQQVNEYINNIFLIHESDLINRFEIEEKIKNGELLKFDSSIYKPIINNLAIKTLQKVFPDIPIQKDDINRKVYIVTNKKIIFINNYLDFNLDRLLNELENSILYFSTVYDLNNYVELKILIYDFWLMALFLHHSTKDMTSKKSSNYQDALNYFDKIITISKSRIFSPVNQNRFKSLNKIAFSYELINLELYKDL